MIKIDLSIEALLARRELAEKATPGPWRKKYADTSTKKSSTCCGRRQSEMY